MTARTFLFAAVASDTWGEVIIALSIADEIHAAGERVVFVAPRSVSKLFEGKPFKHGWIDPSAGCIHEALPALARQTGADCVVLVDAALVYMHLEVLGRASGFLDRFEVPVVALDVWDLPHSGVAWDFGPHVWTHVPEALEPALRLVPSPLARPDSDRRAVFAALPDANRYRGRRRLRDELGVGDKLPLVLLPTASWQRPDAQKHEYNATLARTFPAYLASLLERIDSRALVAHIGPLRFDVVERALGDRYRWYPQIPASSFDDWISAADVLLSFNASATSIAAAISARTPVVLGINSHQGRAAEIAARLERPSAELRSWLESSSPLYPFCVWPFGFHRFLTPLLEGNPYRECMEVVEVVDERALTAALDELLADRRAAARMRDRQSAFASRVAALPSGGEVLVRHLAGV